MIDVVHFDELKPEATRQRPPDANEIGVMTNLIPTREAGEKLQLLRPGWGVIRKWRNMDGPGAHRAVSVLSPYIRRRLVLEVEAVAEALSTHGLENAEKFVQEVSGAVILRVGWSAALRFGTIIAKDWTLI